MDFKDQIYKLRCEAKNLRDVAQIHRNRAKDKRREADAAKAYAKEADAMAQGQEDRATEWEAAADKLESTL